MCAGKAEGERERKDAAKTVSVKNTGKKMLVADRETNTAKM